MTFFCPLPGMQVPMILNYQHLCALNMVQYFFLSALRYFEQWFLYSLLVDSCMPSAVVQYMIPEVHSLPCLGFSSTFSMWTVVAAVVAWVIPPPFEFDIFLPYMRCTIEFWLAVYARSHILYRAQSCSSLGQTYHAIASYTQYTGCCVKQFLRQTVLFCSDRVQYFSIALQWHGHFSTDFTGKKGEIYYLATTMHVLMVKISTICTCLVFTTQSRLGNRRFEAAGTPL